MIAQCVNVIHDFLFARRGACGGVSWSVVYYISIASKPGIVSVQNGLTLAAGGSCLYFGANW